MLGMMKIGVILPSLSDQFDLTTEARYAEDAGLDSVWMPTPA
jgi:hypothetical protein